MRKAYMGDKVVTLHGKAPELNQEVIVKGALAGSFEQVELERKHDYLVLITFPSIDTSVCDLQVLFLSQLTEKYPNFDYASISVDLPTALNSYKSSHPTGSIQLFSDYYDLKLSKELGVLMEENRLSARAVFIVNKENKIVYLQINEQVKDQMDFKALESKLQELSK
ncbi:redoxin family protein [Mycoplasma corogypsi]|uniref:redoxin family protein n=1 Tax=Mycoplasma corogypsi TaxID=2106 RepID=UPI003873B5F1